MAKLSIGIAVLNGADHIRDLLESLKSQYSAQMQIIILDGGSVDGSQAIIREYMNLIYYYESKPDGGIYDAYNLIREIASGEYLLYLGCDDKYLFGKSIEKKLPISKSIIYYGNVFVLNGSNIYDGYFSKFKIIKKNICHQAIFYPKIVYKKFSYDLRYPLLSDYEYNLRLIGNGYCFSYFNELVAVYNNQGRSAIGDKIFNRYKIKIIFDNLGIIYFFCYIGYKLFKLFLKLFFIVNKFIRLGFREGKFFKT